MYRRALERIAIVSCLLALPVLASAKPYAERPAKMTELEEMSAERFVVPDASKVPFPAYPGAIAVSAGKPKNRPSFVTLVTKDPIDEVVAYYKEKLDGWKVTKNALGSWYFYQGKEMRQTDMKLDGPGVMIYETTGTSPDETQTKWAKTKIFVQYQ